MQGCGMCGKCIPLKLNPPTLEMPNLATDLQIAQTPDLSIGASVCELSHMCLVLMAKHMQR
jgi:hypothetical protein